MCNIHVVHNAFGKGLDKFEREVEELAIDLHSLFRYSSARREDFKFVELQLDIEQNMFLRHVPTRWLSLQPVNTRILQLFPALEKYMKDMTKNSNTPKSIAYGRIIQGVIQDKYKTLTQLDFLSNVTSLFTDFLTCFQTSAPMIHVLHEEMFAMVKTIMNRFVKSEVMQSVSGTKQLLTVKYDDLGNQLSGNKLSVGLQTREILRNEILRKIKVKGQRRQLMLGMRDFYNASVGHLLSRLPFENQLLYDVRILNPKHRTDAGCFKSVE